MGNTLEGGVIDLQKRQTGTKVDRAKQILGEKERARKAAIIQAFLALETGMDIGASQYADLLKNLVETGDHIYDAIAIAHIADNLWAKGLGALLPNIRREDFVIAALCHDIGKAGPLNVPQELRLVVQCLFDKRGPEGVLPNGKRIPNATVSDFIDGCSDDIFEVFDGGKEEAKAILRREGSKLLPADEAGRDAKPVMEMPILDFFRLHPGWTLQILRDLQARMAISEKVPVIAASHHLFEEKDPATVLEDPALKNEKEAGAALEVLRVYITLEVIGQLGK